nr:hypothetical protein [uncultured Pedobacter sp.]
MNGEKAGRNDCQNQSITYNLDDGMTWTKYAGNPVLKIIELLYYYRIKFHIAVSVVNIIYAFLQKLKLTYL